MHADRAELLAELVLARRSETTATGLRARGARDLDRHRAEAAGAAPDQHGVAGRTLCGGQPCSMRYAVAPTSMYAAASSHVRCVGFGRHWCACTFVNCAKLPQFVS